MSILAAGAVLLVAAAAFAAPASYSPGTLDGQNGWNGGAPCGSFVNNDAGDEAVQAAVAHAGTQAWRFGRGYGSPGCGTPFSPATASVGRPSSGAAGDVSVVRLAFKAVTPGDESVQSLYLGAVARDDRTGSHVVLRNEAAGVRLTMSTFNPGPACDDFATVDIATVSAADWHTVKMTTQYHEDPSLDVTHYVIDEGTPGEVTADEVSWPHPWRQCNGFAYAPGASLKFANISPDTTAFNGFYYDDVSLHVIDSSTSATAGFVGTGFEAAEDVRPPAVLGDFRETRRGSQIGIGPDLREGQPVAPHVTAINFTGTVGAAGDTWVTVYDPTPLVPTPATVFTGSVSLSADVLIARVNNAKGAGLLALYNEPLPATAKGLALILIDNGNTDRLVLATVTGAPSPPGTASVPTALMTKMLAPGQIAVNKWYRVTMDVVVTGGSFSVTGKVFGHTDPLDPNSPAGAQEGGSLVFPSTTLASKGLAASGEVGIVATATSAVVNSSVTNFAIKP